MIRAKAGSGHIVIEITGREPYYIWSEKDAFLLTVELCQLINRIWNLRSRIEPLKVE
ncbi:MAG: hypothetical protein MN733_05595 [Nitrososphaera sp.]|nr:hypothetical protein [Nitrososphaera sp.]